MKNKEIEELLKYLKNKFYISGEFYAEEKIKVLSKKELELLLSYIEQLEEELKEEQEENYKQSEWLVKKQKKIEQLEKKVDQYENPDDLTLFYMWLDEKAKDKMKQLENNRDKAIEYINEMSGYDVEDYIRQDLLLILKGGSDE